MKLTATLLVAALCGCGTTAVEALEVADARWIRATGIREPMPARIVVRWGMFECGVQPTAVGCYSYRTDTVYLDLNRTEEQLARTATHEWGHRLGAEHGGRGVMGPAGAHATSRCITQDDLDMVCSKRECLWEKPECQ
jgi:hypothetical protein